MDSIPYYERSATGDLKTEVFYLPLSECKVIFYDKEGDPVEPGLGVKITKSNWTIEHPLIDQNSICKANFELDYTDTGPMYVRIETYIPMRIQVSDKDKRMDMLEEFEKPLMTELFKKCPNIDKFEKTETLNIRVDGAKANSLVLKDIWVGCIKASNGREQPIIWFKFKEEKLEVGTIEAAETYEYANPNKFDLDEIAKTVNKVTLAYRANQR